MVGKITVSSHISKIYEHEIKRAKRVRAFILVRRMLFAAAIGLGLGFAICGALCGEFSVAADNHICEHVVGDRVSHISD